MLWIGIAYLAQSPQLAKQMCIAADMEKVYEIGPGMFGSIRVTLLDFTHVKLNDFTVFRAENSYTHRHMTEFIGLDLEMTFEEHYHEVMETIDEMLKHIFTGISTKYAGEIETIKKQFPHDEFVWREKTLVLSYAEAIKILQDEGVQQLKREGDSEVMGVIGDHDDMRLVLSPLSRFYIITYFFFDVWLISIFFTHTQTIVPLLRRH